MSTLRMGVKNGVENVLIKMLMRMFLKITKVLIDLNWDDFLSPIWQTC
jgi:hypothetical protein